MAEQVAAPGPNTSVDPRVERSLTKIGHVIRWLAVGYAGLSLIGILIPRLGELNPGPSLIRDIAPAAALPLTMLTLGALLAGDIDVSNSWAGPIRSVGILLAGLMGLFGTFIMVVFFANRTDIWGDIVQVPAFSVGVILLVLGVSIPLSVSRIESRVVAGQVGSLLVFSITAVIFVGYMYGDPSSFLAVNSMDFVSVRQATPNSISPRVLAKMA